MTALNRLVLTDAGSFSDLALGFGFADSDPDDGALTDGQRSGFYLDRVEQYIGLVIDGQLAARIYVDRVEYATAVSRELQPVAGEPVAAFDAVYIAADGQAFLATNASSGVLASQVYVAHSAATLSQPVQLYSLGAVVRNPSWSWTPGQPLYLSGTPGQLSTSVPGSGYTGPVAYATAAQVVILAPESSIAVHAAQLTGPHGITAVGSSIVTSTTTADARTALELGSAATADLSTLATAAQGALADTAVQPGDDALVLGSGAVAAGRRLAADGMGGTVWSDVPDVTSVNGFGGDVTLTAFNVGATEEAPIDGQQYARQDGTWAVVVGGGGGGATNLSATQAASSVTVNSDTGTDATIPAASTTLAGVLSASDKTKLDGIEAGANSYTHPAGGGDQPSVALFGSAVISQVQVDATGHVTGVAQRNLVPADVGAAASSHTHVAADIDSGAATAGQVLTADGAGDASWQTPASGGTDLVIDGGNFADSMTPSNFDFDGGAF